MKHEEVFTEREQFIVDTLLGHFRNMMTEPDPRIKKDHLRAIQAFLQDNDDVPADRRDVISRYVMFAAAAQTVVKVGIDEDPT